MSWSSSGSSNRWSFLSNSSGSVAVKYSGVEVGRVTMLVDTWHHIVGTYDGTTARIYLDGVFDDDLVRAVNDGSFELTIGCSRDCSGHPWDGPIDDVRIYNRALTQVDITELYNYSRTPLICTSFTYTDWSPTTCPSNETQTRTVTSLSPSGCAGGSPTTTQSCTYTPPAGDTTPPSTPTNLTATAISSSQINLSWNASTDDTAVTGYNIYRCTGASCTPALTTTVTGTSYSNTGLTAETTYTYTVSAYDAQDNTSAQSTQASATTQVEEVSLPTTNYGNHNYTDEQITAFTTAELNSVLSNVPTTHPRIFFKESEIEALKARVGIGSPSDYDLSTLKWRDKNITFGEMASEYQTLRNMAVTYRNDPEGMWTKVDINKKTRLIAWTAVAYAFVNLLEPDQAYVASAQIYVR